jgi:hypothetical protein
MDARIVDGGMAVSANVFNLLAVAVFLCRASGLRRAEWTLGIAIVALALPLVLGVSANLIAKREWWTVVLPTILIIYCVVELLFDYLLTLDFRQTALLWPYLALFYLGAMAMIGYSFLVSRAYGFTTLITYFLGLLAAWYSYSRVGHG